MTIASAMPGEQKTEKKPRSDGNLMPGTFPGGGTTVALFSEKCKKKAEAVKAQNEVQAYGLRRERDGNL